MPAIAGSRLVLSSSMLACAMLVCISSCGEDPLGPPPVDYDYFPFLPGMKWVYEYSGEGHSSELGNYTISGSRTIRIGSASTHAEGFEVYPRYVAWHKVLTPAGSGDITVLTGSDTAYIVASDEEVRIYPNLVDSTYYLELVYPLELGATWLWSPGNYLEVTSTTEYVPTPFQEFINCVEIRATNPSYPGSYSDTYYDAVYGQVMMGGHYEGPEPGDWEDWQYALDEFDY